MQKNAHSVARKVIIRVYACCDYNCENSHAFIKIEKAQENKMVVLE